MNTAASRTISAAAMALALTATRQREQELKDQLYQNGIRAVAVDAGGQFLAAIPKIVERAVVAAKREGVITPTHAEEGAVAGATHEALTQIMHKAMGLNVGGKIAIARQGEHISVALFLGIGLVHLDEVAVSLSHRAIKGD